MLSSDLFAVPSEQPAVWSVSFLVNSARLLLEKQLGAVWVTGEISGFTRAASGHCYFTLKDDRAQARCTLWKHKAAALRLPRDGLRDGAHVEVRVTPTLYEARGDFQLNVDTLKLAGQGALYEKFLRLKATLEAEGLFAPEKKRALPSFPCGVGLVTSAHGAALRDMLTTLKTRWSSLPVIIYPTAVQGDGAAEQIVVAIQTANARAFQDGVEVLIVARGGGSLEDLWAFNEEIVARAVAASALPVISGVGHETDITLSDFAADARAPTPTTAAAMVAPDGEMWRHAHYEQIRRWRRAMAYRLGQAAQRLDDAAQRLKHLRADIAAQHAQIDAFAQRLKQAWRRQNSPLAQYLEFVCLRWRRQTERPLPQWTVVEQTRQTVHRAADQYLEARAQKLILLSERLTLLNPRQVLERGYAVVSRADGKIVRDAATLRDQESVHMRFARGDAQATIQKTSS
ncbi:MAG: exodeoxyribonuclease VII large subunit [Burkholderiales bacterium]|jgi:exodeoxyribonuclease VII large subunit|nr:exodeoxyribonuclease VII large subunit [Burkholderiales bacterium]